MAQQQESICQKKPCVSSQYSATLFTFKYIVNLRQAWGFRGWCNSYIQDLLLLPQFQRYLRPERLPVVEQQLCDCSACWDSRANMFLSHLYFFLVSSTISVSLGCDSLISVRMERTRSSLMEQEEVAWCSTALRVPPCVQLSSFVHNTISYFLAWTSDEDGGSAGRWCRTWWDDGASCAVSSLDLTLGFRSWGCL